MKITSEKILGDVSGFLNELNARTYISSDMLNVNEDSIIGESSDIVTVYDHEDYVIKKIDLAADTDNLLLKSIIHDMIFRGDTTRIPNSITNKKTLSIPNPVCECIINTLLNDNIVTKYTDGFCKIYGFQFNPESKLFYIKMEKLDGWYDKFVSGGKIIKNRLFYSIFQIAFSLEVAQRIYRFTHFDVHNKNILTRKKDEKIVYVYYINGKYLYTKFDFETVMIDFGWSRMETDDFILNPKIRFCKYQNSVDDSFNHYEYNPYYDLVGLFRVLLMWINKNEYNTKYITELYLILLNLNKRYSSHESDSFLISRIYKFIKKAYYAGSWRPEPNNFTSVDDEEVENPLSPGEFLYNFVDYIYQRTYQSIKIDNREELLYCLTDFGGMYISNNFIQLLPDEYKYFELPFSEKYMNNVHYDFIKAENLNARTIHQGVSLFSPVISISNCGELNAIDGVYYGTREYNRLRPQSIKLFGSYKKQQVFHISKINQEGCIKEGFEFRIDGCRIDIASYMRSYYVKGGIAISGSYFSKGSYKPVGYFKSEDRSLTFSPIPYKYKEYYAAICIENKKIKIDYTLDENYLNTRYSRYLCAGPILIKDGEIVFSEDLANIKKGGAFVFQSENKLKHDHYDVPNYDYISPGELSNSANPDARTILAFDDEGCVYFIYFEGKEKRGIGIDLVLLTLYLKHTYKFTHAVSINEGHGLQLVYKNEEDCGVIYQANPQCNFSYPCGSVISCVKLKF